MSNLRERFWIISLRKICKQIISECVVCQRHKAKYMQCESPPLPLDRVRDSVVFETTGVDYAGLLYTREGTKAWICLFTCAVYRAVHLELASSLSVSFGSRRVCRMFTTFYSTPRTTTCLLL